MLKMILTWLIKYVIYINWNKKVAVAIRLVPESGSYFRQKCHIITGRWGRSVVNLKQYTRGSYDDMFAVNCHASIIYYSDVTMGAMASQITGVSIVCSTVCSGADQWKHQSSASLAFVKGIHRWPIDSPRKGPVTRFHLMTSSCHILRNGFVNSLRPRRNRRHFADDIFKCTLLNENVLISIKISLKFIPKGPINNIPALV